MLISMAVVFATTVAYWKMLEMHRLVLNLVSKENTEHGFPLENIEKVTLQEIETSPPKLQKEMHVLEPHLQQRATQI